MKGQGSFTREIPGSKNWLMRPSAPFRLLTLALACAGMAVCAGPALALSPGDPDPAFGSDGVVYYSLGVGPTPAAQIDAAAVQPDGKIVLAGNATDPNGRKTMLVARLDPNGALDQGFGDGGTVIKQLG